MLVTFFDMKGIVPFKFIPQGQIASQTYVEMMKRLGEAVRRIRPEIWPIDWILHHCGAPCLWSKKRLLEWKPTLFP